MHKEIAMNKPYPTPHIEKFSASAQGRQFFTTAMYTTLAALLLGLSLMIGLLVVDPGGASRESSGNPIWPSLLLESWAGGGSLATETHPPG